MSESNRQSDSPRPDITTDAVREALGNWHNLAALGEQPLARLAVVEQRRLSAGHGEGENGRGLALRQVLAEALAALKPKGEGEPDYGEKLWQPYLLLHERYVNGREVSVVADLLGMGASTASRKSTAAIKRVASTLYAWEQQTRSASKGVNEVAESTTGTAVPADHKVGQSRSGRPQPTRTAPWLRRNWSYITNIALGLAVVALTIALLAARASMPELSSIDTTVLTLGPVNEPVDVSSLLTDLDVASQRAYEWHLLQPRLSMYTDRSNFYFLEYPPELQNQPLLVTANDDKAGSAADEDFLVFHMQKDAMVYVLYTTIDTKLEDIWLLEQNGWVAEPAIVNTTLPEGEKVRHIRRKFYEAGSIVQLGGNGGTSNDTSMYNLVVVPVEQAGWLK